VLEELGRRREEGSATRTGLERELALVRDRLPVVPREMDRLIDGYGKGLIPDDRMRTRMSALTEERSQIEEKRKSLEPGSCGSSRPKVSKTRSSRLSRRCGTRWTCSMKRADVASWSLSWRT